VLAPFIDSERFDTLINNLERAQNTGGLTPELKDIFRVFYECPYDKFKVVIINPEPYCEPGVANGIALCCGKTEVVEEPLTSIFEELQSTVYKDEGGWYLWREDLTRWSNQGILMLNASLTTEPGKAKVHNDIWKSFTDFLFSRLAELNEEIVYITMDRPLEAWLVDIPSENNYKLTCYYSDSLISKAFSRTNEILEETNRTKIIW
jgi:uracil-DNA glycosylase